MERSQEPPAASFSSLVATYRPSHLARKRRGKKKGEGGLGRAEIGKPYLRHYCLLCLWSSICTRLMDSLRCSSVPIQMLRRRGVFVTLSTKSEQWQTDFCRRAFKTVDVYCWRWQGWYQITVHYKVQIQPYYTVWPSYTATGLRSHWRVWYKSQHKLRKGKVGNAWQLPPSLSMGQLIPFYFLRKMTRGSPKKWISFHLATATRYDDSFDTCCCLICLSSWGEIPLGTRLKVSSEV